jgi:hypothetical protein
MGKEKWLNSHFNIILDNGYFSNTLHCEGCAPHQSNFIAGGRRVKKSELKFAQKYDISPRRGWGDVICIKIIKGD